jgi:hypothetical protein
VTDHRDDAALWLAIEHQVNQNNAENEYRRIGFRYEPELGHWVATVTVEYFSEALETEHHATGDSIRAALERLADRVGA